MTIKAKDWHRACYAKSKPFTIGGIMKNKALLLQVANLINDQRADVDVKVPAHRELKFYLLSPRMDEKQEPGIETQQSIVAQEVIPSEIMHVLNRNICDEYHGLKYFEKLLMVKAWNLSDTIAH